MSSGRLTDMEKKINEVRHRLASLSRSFQYDEDDVFPSAAEARNDAERKPLVLTERDVNESIAVKSEVPVPTAALNRLAGHATREAVQRDNGNAAPRTSGCKESAMPPFSSPDKSPASTQAPTSDDATPAAAAQSPPPSSQYCVTAAVPAFDLHTSTRPLSQTVLGSNNSTKRAPSSCGGRSSNGDIPAARTTSTFQVGGEVTDGFDPFQAMQARLREKLRKSAFSRSPLSSPESDAKSPLPKPQDVWQKTQPEALIYYPNDVGNGDVLPGASQSELNRGKQEQQQENIDQQEHREERPSTGTSVPNMRAAVCDIRHVKQRFAASQGSPGVGSSSYSSAIGEESRQKHTVPHPGRKDVRARSSSEFFCSASATNSLTKGSSVQTPRRASVVDSRRQSPSRVNPYVLPRKTTPQRNVLDVLTGAEVFALMRLRGVIVSRGETGECTLPETRCHSIYLSPDEHKQLLELRANIGLRPLSVKRTTSARQGSRRRSDSTGSLSKGMPSRQSSPIVTHRTPKWQC